MQNSLEHYRKAVQFLEEHLFEKLCVSDIASFCGVSTSGLEKHFARCNQRGVMRVFLNLKLEKAAKMLKEGYTVNHLAKMFRFSSQAHFSMAFKKKYGVSPLQYKYSSIK